MHKSFIGGHVTLAGANSPASLASRPVRVLLCDEVDHYPESAGAEGDPLTLAIARTSNFWNRKIIIVSTPTLKKISRVYKEFEMSTQEEFETPCPNCGEFVRYDFENVEYKDMREPVLKCPHCGGKFPRRMWHAMQKNSRWQAVNPGAKNRGFHMNAFASPWLSWVELCDKYEAAKNTGEEALKVFHNTVLGLPYEYNAVSVDISEFEERREEYGAEVPENVRVLTAGIDVQDDRLEVEIVGWGAKYESWSIDYKIIFGSPGGNDVWQELDAILTRGYKKADGEEFLISCACIDSAGHFTDDVYKFVKPRKEQRIFAIVGRGTYGLPSVSRPNYKNRARIALFTVGVSTLKGLLYSRLSAKENQAGYCHFPKKENYTRGYFDGLMSETMKIKRVGGQDKIVWEKKTAHARNEPLDCRIYAMAALAIYNPDLTRKRSGVAKKIIEPEKVKRTGIILKRGITL